MQGLVRENVNHHPAPVPVWRSESAGMCMAQIPQVDGRRAPVFRGIPVRKTERDRGAEEPRPSGPGDPGQLGLWDFRLPQVEHPSDAAVAQRGNRIPIRALALGDASGDYRTFETVRSVLGIAYSIGTRGGILSPRFSRAYLHATVAVLFRPHHGPPESEPRESLPVESGRFSLGATSGRSD